MKTLFGLASILALVSSAGAAQAHVAVQPTTAPTGADETLTFVVGHGCDGQATTALRVELPAAITGVKPEPKAGWTLAVERLPSGSVAVTWRGELAAHQPDSFSLAVKLPSVVQVLRLPAVQSCGAAEVRWDETVSPGGPRPAHPAPTVTLTPSK